MKCMEATLLYLQPNEYILDAVQEGIKMKFFVAVAGALLVTVGTIAAQGQAASPAATESKAIGGKTITITYSSPRVKGREGKLFGKDGHIAQDPNYPVWRAGANTATKLHTDANLQIGDLSVSKGDYSLFVDISDPDNWQLIVNKQTGQSGLKYDKSRDLGSTKMTMSKPPAIVEDLKYTITDDGGNKGTLTLAWEDHIATVPIVVK